MKKKLILTTILSFAIGFFIINIFLHHNQVKIDKLMLENIEALAENVSFTDTFTDTDANRVKKHCAGDSRPEEYGCYADNHGADCKRQGDCRR